MLDAYPAGVRFSTNPCPCGFFGDPKKDCHCTPRQVQHYLSKISGPLLDRIDIHIEVPAVGYRDLSDKTEGTSSSEMREIVTRTRIIQASRFRNDSITTNSRMTSRLLKKHCRMDEESERLVRQAIDEIGLSARAYTKILKTARTIADMDNTEQIQPHHISEAIQYRSLDRSRFA